MDVSKTDKSLIVGSAGEPGLSAGSGTDGFSSKWSHILAEPVSTSWSDEESERRVEQFLTRAWKFWQPAYAYLRFKGCERATVFFDLQHALPFVALWLSNPDYAHLRRFRLWLFEALREYVEFRLHVSSRLFKQIPITVSPAICEFEETVRVALASKERFDDELHYPEKLYDRAWVQALETEAWIELLDRWPTLGETCPLPLFYDFRLEQPTAADYGDLSDTLEMADEEVVMVVSRLHRHFREMLREKIRDTVTSPEELEEEWAELFPKQVSKKPGRGA